MDTLVDSTQTENSQGQLELLVEEKVKGRASQAFKILDAVKRSPVENWKLAEISLKYSSRIAELRKRGYKIKATRVSYRGRPSGTWLYTIDE